MLINYEPVRYKDHTYDVRVVNAPLEMLMLRRAMTGPRGSSDTMLAAMFLLDYEFILDAWARGVHAVAFEDEPHGRVCTCGLVTGARPLHAVGGHLDTMTFEVTDDVVFALPTG
ncbi:MAG: hypothetical protein ABIP45_03820 [Knoellia sp.]